MQGDFEFHINGVPHRSAGASTTLTLLEYLRENMLTAAKDGCGDGACGSCSVLLVDSDENGDPAFRVTNSCLLTLPMLAGRQLWTAEALSAGEDLHPVQQALEPCGSFGCGYCLPGVSMAICEAYESGGRRTLGDVVGQLEGNLCRCTGYRPLRDAMIIALRSAQSTAGTPSLSRKLPAARPALPPLTYLDRDEVTYYRPASFLEVLRLRQAHPEARIVAGGTSRIWDKEEDGNAGQGLSAISLEGIAELSEVRREGEDWSIGATVTITDLAARLGEEYPMLAQMARRFGSPQIRNRATVGGNLVAAAHHSDLVPVLLAYGASAEVEGLDGSREIPLDEFFTDYRLTAMAEGEMLKAIRLPRCAPLGAGSGAVHRLQSFYKVSKRGGNDRAIANAAIFVEINGEGLLHRSRLAFGGVAAFGARAYDAETAMWRKPWEAKTAQTVAGALKETFPCSADQRASASYRNALVAGLWQKFFTEHRDPASSSCVDASLQRHLAKEVVTG